MTPRYLLDTSVLIERERATASAALPEGEWAISAVTLSELNLGVLIASSTAVRQRRLASFESVSDALVLPFDDVTARTHAELVAWSREQGVMPSVADGMVAATAATNGITLVTLDRDFQRLGGFEGLELVVL